MCQKETLEKNTKYPIELQVFEPYNNLINIGNGII